MLRHPPIAVSRLILAMLIAVVATSAADARSRQGRHHGHRAQHDASAARSEGRQAGKSSQVRAASEEIDKVIDGKIKNICRGC